MVKIGPETNGIGAQSMRFAAGSIPGDRPDGRAGFTPLHARGAEPSATHQKTIAARDVKPGTRPPDRTIAVRAQASGGAREHRPAGGQADKPASPADNTDGARVVSEHRGGVAVAAVRDPQEPPFLLFNRGWGSSKELINELLGLAEEEQAGNASPPGPPDKPPTGGNGGGMDEQPEEHEGDDSQDPHAVSPPREPMREAAESSADQEERTDPSRFRPVLQDALLGSERFSDGLKVYREISGARVWVTSYPTGLTTTYWDKHQSSSANEELHREGIRDGWGSISVRVQPSQRERDAKGRVVESYWYEFATPSELATLVPHLATVLGVSNEEIMDAEERLLARRRGEGDLSEKPFTPREVRDELGLDTDLDKPVIIATTHFLFDADESEVLSKHSDQRHVARLEAINEALIPEHIKEQREREHRATVRELQGGLSDVLLNDSDHPWERFEGFYIHGNLDDGNKFEVSARHAWTDRFYQSGERKMFSEERDRELLSERKAIVTVIATCGPEERDGEDQVSAYEYRFVIPSRIGRVVELSPILGVPRKEIEAYQNKRDYWEQHSVTPQEVRDHFRSTVDLDEPIITVRTELPFTTRPDFVLTDVTDISNPHVRRLREIFQLVSGEDK